MMRAVLGAMGGLVAMLAVSGVTPAIGADATMNPPRSEGGSDSILDRLADGLPGQNIVQIGIQPFANSQAYAQVANDAGVTVVTMSQIRAHGVERLLTESLDDLSERVENIYVDLDIDSLDRVFAPATPGSRPGGLTPYELRRVAWLCGAHPLVRAIDLVEVDPTQDVADATVMATASCLLSFASGLLARN